MNRRDFTRQAAAAAGGLGVSQLLSGAAQAQAAAPVEGKNFVRLERPAPVSAPAGKIEVVEFFWYGCPHCHHLEPALNAWVAKLPPDVVFKRVPVAFRENPFVAHQRLYYAIEALGLTAELHGKVFRAIHAEQARLDKPELIAEFVARQGVDKDKFMAAYNAFAMQTKLAQARSLAEAYKLDGVPTLGVAGRYFTSLALNATPEKTLVVADFLIAQVRKAR